MFRISSFVALLVVLAASSLQVILASPAFSQPVASTTGQGGQPLSVVWADNGQSPAYNAQSWGNSTLYLATGDTDTQYKLQTLHANMPPSRMSGHFKIDPTVGPNGQYYFMRMEGTNTVNNIPVMAFSARFTLNGMTGTFNSTVMQAAQGKEGPAVGSSSSSSSSSAAMSTSISSSNSGSAFPTQVATTNTSSSTSTTKSSDAGRLSNSFFTVVGAGALTALGMMAFI